MTDSPDLAAAKTALRERLIEQRRVRREQSTAQELIRRAATVATTVLADPRLNLRHSKQLVASYVSLPSEPPTQDLHRALLAAGHRVIAPEYRHPDGSHKTEMSWHPIGPTGRMVDEEVDVAQADLIVIPALAAGRNGSRLGKGKGFYDKCLAEVPRHPQGPLRVALVGPDEVFDAVPTQSHDEPVDVVIAV